MGFVGDGGNIAISTDLPPSFCVLYCEHQIISGISITYVLCLPEALVSGFETHPGLQRPVPTVCRPICSNVLGLPGTLVTWPWRSLRMAYCCALGLVSDMCHVSELLVPGFGRPVLMCRGRTPRAREMMAYLCDGYEASRQPKFECGCCEMRLHRVCDASQNLYVFSF